MLHSYWLVGKVGACCSLCLFSSIVYQTVVSKIHIDCKATVTMPFATVAQLLVPRPQGTANPTTFYRDSLLPGRGFMKIL